MAAQQAIKVDTVIPAHLPSNCRSGAYVQCQIKRQHRSNPKASDYRRVAEMLDQLITASILYPLVSLLFMGSTEIGTWLGLRFRAKTISPEGMATWTVSTLGLLALLLAFSLSHALSRYETRRDLVLEEANAIGSTADFALMLPEEAQRPILDMLRDYAAVRIGLGIPYDPAKLERDAARSTDLLAGLWRAAVAVSDPRSLSAHRFTNALDEMTKIQEKRLSAHRYHVPDIAVVVLLGVALIALGFTGYQAGLSGTRLRAANLIMAGMIAVVTVLVIDLDQPARGLVKVPTQPLAEVAKRIQF